MLKDKIKQLIKIGEQDDNKKKIENLAIFLVILIVTLLAINFIWNGKSTKKEPAVDKNKKLAEDNEQVVQVSAIDSGSKLSTELEEILKNIKGVGKVKVLVTYSQTSQVVPMYNEDTSQTDTEETDTNGGKRKVVSTEINKEIIYQEENGEKQPITQSIVSPKIEGAIITAEGASNTEIKTNIIQAVEAATRYFNT